MSAAFAAALFAVAGPAAATTGPTSATVLSLTGFSSIVADSTHQKVFVSGVGTDPVEVTDFTGKELSTLHSIRGATALALSLDDHILYAAIGGTDEIDALDTSTMEKVAAYFTGSGYDPQHLAVVGKDVWFGYGSGGNAGIGVLDPVALTVNTTRESSFYNAPTLAASPSAPNTLVAGDPHMSASVIESFDVTTGAPVTIATSNPYLQPDGCENLNQLAIAADGTDVISACGSPYYGAQLTLSSMTEDATYTTGPYPTSVAVAPGSGTVAVGLDSTGNSVYLFAPGVSTATASYTLGGSSVYGLAWNQSGSELFAVSVPVSPSTSTPTLNVINVS